MEILLYLLTGAVTGVLSGLFGIGGGIVIVGMLAYLFTQMGFPEAHIMHMALGTSLATIMLTSISSARAHHHKGNVAWPIVRQLALPIVAGTLLGSVLAAQLHSNWLKLIFAIFLLAVATQLLLNLKPHPHRQLPVPWLNSLVGGFIGVISSLVGIGGGTVSVPYLVYCNIDLRRAIGTSSALGLPIAVAGAIGYAANGLGLNLPPYSLGFIYLPAFAGIAVASVATAPLGARLAHRLPTDVLRRLFGGFLLILGGRMLWGITA